MKIFLSLLLLVIGLLPINSHAQISEILRVPDNNLNNQIEAFDMTPDGRYIVFDSYTDALVASDDNGFQDVFLYDVSSETLELISIGVSSADGNNTSKGPTISDDGRYIAFSSGASNLVSGDTNSLFDIFVYDRDLDSMERVSLSHLGAQVTTGQSTSGFISGNGRYVTFATEATDMVADADLNNDDADIMVYDRQADTVERISVDSAGAQADNGSDAPTITPDGRYVTFISNASNLVSGDTNGTYDVFVYDRNTDTTEVVSIDDSGDFSTDDCDSQGISSNGRYVTYKCVDTTNWPEGLSAGIHGVFLYDRNTDDISLVSTKSDGSTPNDSSFSPSISGDGRYILFTSDATDLVSGDTNARTDYFVKDTLTGLVVRASENVNGVESDGNTSKIRTKLSTNGAFIIFASSATNLVSGDTNDVNDIFRVKLSDDDGVSDAIEEAGPNTGDVDEDGYLDSMDHDTSTLENSVTGDYMSVSLEGACFDSEGVTSISESSLSSRDSIYNYPLGILDFSINCRTATGDSATVTMYLFGDNDVTGLSLRKVSDDGTSVLVPGVSINEVTIDGEPVTEIVYSITDGSSLDEDDLVNGVIIDPVGLAVAGPEETSTSSSSGSRPSKKIALNTATQVNNGQVSEACYTFVTNMKMGSRYGEIAKLQEKLNNSNFNAGVVDGLFGPMTNSAVKMFQTSKGLVSDGIVGPMTRDELNRCS